MKNENNTKNNKIIPINPNITTPNFIQIKKLKIMFIVVILTFTLLIGRIGFLQFVQGSYLKEIAYKQQSINQIISPKRGTIYDSTGKILATSASVDTITINPSKIKVSEKDTDKKPEETAEKTKILKEKVAKALSEIFELNYEETLAKTNSTAQVETIAKKVEQDKVDKLKTWMKDNNITVRNKHRC